jgi:hypothetical protein
MLKLPSTSQSHFDYILSLKRDWFSSKEVALVLGKSDQYVRNAYEAGQLLGHAMNGSARRGEEKRKTYQFHKEGILLFLIQTANYEPQDFMRALEYIISNRTTEQLKALQVLIHKRIQFGI